MKRHRCKVLNQTRISENIYSLVLESSEIASVSSPGQFVYIRVTNGLYPLLRRPLSIHRVDSKKGEIKLLYRVVGRGTECLQYLKEGDVVDLLGPLGTGFCFKKSFSHAIIVAGGMGSAPVFFLIDKLLELEKDVTFFWGVKNKSEVFALNDLRNLGVNVKIITEDGSMGEKGLVTDILKPFLAKYRENRSVEGFACGPVGMLKQIQKMTEVTVFDWQVSLEERMACGIGVCMGCGVKMKKGGYKMVCSDGPVFNLREILFDG